MRFHVSAKQEEEEEESLPLSYKKRSFSKLYQQGQDKLNSEVSRATKSRKAEGRRRRSAVKAREQFRIETTTKHIRSSVEGQVPYLPYLGTYRIFIHSLHTFIAYMYTRIKKISTESGR